MRDETRRSLLTVNKRFYDDYSTSFGSTREKPWAGWTPILEQLLRETSNRPEEPLRILDVGCGNGRFGVLAARLLEGRRLIYHGLDQSVGLLDQASDALSGKVQGLVLAAVDLGEPFRWVATGDPEPYDLISIFGVLHHMPAEDRRYSLLSSLIERLAPGGKLWASWWMLHRTQRFAKKVVPWQRLTDADPELSFDERDLEEGDSLLSWQRDGFGLRYLHFPSDRELERLETLPGSTFLRRFESDGPTGKENLYLGWTC